MVRKNKNPEGKQPAGEDSGQSSHTIRGKLLSLKEKWRAICAEIDAVGTTVKEETNTWNRKL